MPVPQYVPVPVSARASPGVDLNAGIGVRTIAWHKDSAASEISNAIMKPAPPQYVMTIRKPPREVIYSDADP